MKKSKDEYGYSYKQYFSALITKIKKIDKQGISFDNGMYLTSYHDEDCCENHYLEFGDLVEEDWKDLEFDLSNDDFFTRIPDYGIQLNAKNNFPLRIPGYGSNNGYYSDNLSLVLSEPEKEDRTFDVTECQVVSD